MERKKKDVYHVGPLTEGKRNIISALMDEYEIKTAEDMGVRTKTWTHIRALKGVIDVFKRTEGKGATYLSSNRICYRYSASTWLPQQKTPIYLDS